MIPTATRSTRHPPRCTGGRPWWVGEVECARHPRRCAGGERWPVLAAAWTRRLRRPVSVLGWCLGVALAGSAGPAAPAAAQEEIVARGNQLYQAGDFEGAVEAYESVLAAGWESASLHYNLGNAHFKAGSLGRAILAWERARALAPRDPDVLANLELAASRTRDAIEPLPRFWLLSVLDWAVRFIPRGWLLGLSGLGWLAAWGGLTARTLGRRDGLRRLAGWTATAGAVVALAFGANLVVRELDVGRAERAVILEAAVPVRSAPSADDDFTLFEVHEGTVVRVDRRTEEWAEVVLADGKVGWVSAQAMEGV